MGESCAEICRIVREEELALPLSLSRDVYFLWLSANISTKCCRIFCHLSLPLSLSQSLQRSLSEQRCGTEDVDTFPSKIDNDRRDCEAANKQSGKCRQQLTTTTEEEKEEEEEQRAKFVANFSFDLNYDKHAKCCRVAHPTNPRPAQRILYGNVRKKRNEFN